MNSIFITVYSFFKIKTRCYTLYEGIKKTNSTFNMAKFHHFIDLVESANRDRIHWKANTPNYNSYEEIVPKFCFSGVRISSGKEVTNLTRFVDDFQLSFPLSLIYASWTHNMPKIISSSLPHLALGWIWLKGTKGSLPLFIHSSITFHHCLPHDNMFQCSYGTIRKNQNFSPSSLTHIGRPLLLLWLWVFFFNLLYIISSF